MNSIGFFGDSFCADIVSNENYKTYIELLCEKNKLKITNLGVSGSSVGDLIINQLMPLLKNNNIPDVSVICWTCPGRLFHRAVRNINGGTVNNNFQENKELWSSAKSYYDCFADVEFFEITHKSLIEYADNYVLSELSKKSKVINLWVVPYRPDFDFADANDYLHETFTYYHKFKHGIEIQPPLISLSCKNINSPDIFLNDTRPNHIEGHKKNYLLFQWIQTGIENYQNGNIFNYQEDCEACTL